MFAAMGTDPRGTGRLLRGARQSPQGRGLIFILDEQLRPGLEHRQIAERTREVVIAQFALDACRP
jgi:hypothetical protein